MAATRCQYWGEGWANTPGGRPNGGRNPLEADFPEVEPWMQTPFGGTPFLEADPQEADAMEADLLEADPPEANPQRQTE